MSLANMLKSGLGSAANWLDKRPEAPDMLSPLGLAGMGSAPVGALASGAIRRERPPLRGYHGTSEPIERFDPNIRGETTGAESAKRAFWFTKSPDLASDYAVLAGNGPLAAMERRLGEFEAKARAGHELTAPESAEARELYAARDNKRAQVERGDGVMEGANVVPVDLMFKNPLEHDFGGKPYREESYAALLEKALAGGNDGVVFRNTYDPAFPLNGRELTDIYGAYVPGTVRSATTGKTLFSSHSPFPGTIVNSDKDR
jgi:hypothetical protein